MDIFKGKILSAQKVVVYGPEGIGKSTFASLFQKPLFIDIENSTNNLDVDRLRQPKSWSELAEQVKEFSQDPHGYKTLVIDTIDWAELLCIQHVCAAAGKSGIEDFGYGKGYTYVKEQFGKFLNALTDIGQKRGVNIVLTAHARLSKFEQPDEAGAYDRYTLKLTDSPKVSTAALVKEWADAMLFVNYKTYVVTDEKTKKAKATGGRRVMYTQHNPCWDAKNRWGLPEEVDFDYSVIAPYIPDISDEFTKVYEQAEKARNKAAIDAILDEDAASAPSVANAAPAPHTEPPVEPPEPRQIPEALRRLMDANGITEHDIQIAVANNNYYPVDMPVADYDDDFIQGKLIAGWDTFHQAVLYFKNLPFSGE